MDFNNIMDELIGAVIIGPTEDFVDRVTKQIAFTRRSIQILNNDKLLERYDANLRMCLDKWEKYFSNMNKDELNEYMHRVTNGKEV